MITDQDHHITSMKGSYLSPLGYVNFEVNEGGLIHMFFDDAPYQNDEDSLVLKVNQSLDAYFKHQKETFELPIQFEKGTPFQKEVWAALLKIPFGHTKSYQDIAHMIGKPKAIRAVGQACKRNPIGIVVPCHRVIGKQGALTGYSGKDYIELKRQLLLHERVDVRDKRRTKKD